MFAAVLADGWLADEAPPVPAWVPAGTAVSASAETSPGVLVPFGWVALERQQGESLNIRWDQFFLPGFAGPVLRRPGEMSAELPRSLSSHMWKHGATSDLDIRSLTASAMSCCSPSRCWRESSWV